MAGLLAMTMSIAGCTNPPAQQFTCTGTVTFGDQRFADQIALTYSSSEVRVSSVANQASTFEAGLPYSVCSEDETEVAFEYTAAEHCGVGASRTGYFQKALRELRLTRTDRGAEFVGEYKCVSP